jgi:hypothetical protein
MKPWEIWTFDFTEEDSHPAVIISNKDRIDNPDLERVNVLLCTTLRGPASKERLARLKRTEALLDRADGLDWQTIVKCDALHFVKKTGLYQLRGEVSYFRRVEISRKMAEALTLVLG